MNREYFEVRSNTKQTDRVYLQRKDDSVMYVSLDGVVFLNAIPTVYDMLSNNKYSGATHLLEKEVGRVICYIGPNGLISVEDYKELRAKRMLP